MTTLEDLAEVMRTIEQSKREDTVSLGMRVISSRVLPLTRTNPETGETETVEAFIAKPPRDLEPRFQLFDRPYLVVSPRVLAMLDAESLARPIHGHPLGAWVLGSAAQFYPEEAES